MEYGVFDACAAASALHRRALVTVTAMVTAALNITVTAALCVPAPSERKVPSGEERIDVTASMAGSTYLGIAASYIGGM